MIATLQALAADGEVLGEVAPLVFVDECDDGAWCVKVYGLIEARRNGTVTHLRVVRADGQYQSWVALRKPMKAKRGGVVPGTVDIRLAVGSSMYARLGVEG